MFRSLKFFNMSTLKQIYEKQVKQARKTQDPVQLDAIQALQRLNDNLIQKHDAWKKNIQDIRINASQKKIQTEPPQDKRQVSSGFFDQFFGGSQPTKKQSYQQTNNYVPTQKRLDYVRGLYLWGASGCGKTYLSEMFFNNLQIKEKKKVHFHQFMASIHRDLFILQREKKTFDPMVTIAYERSKQSRLLFLDQFQVTDVADATMLKRLFQRMINNGTVLLATSNRQPEQLYKNGIQRQHFVPFIPFLRQHCEVKKMITSDYRYLLKSDPKYSYLHPINQQTDELLDQMFIELTGTKTQKPQCKALLIESSRKLKVPRSKKGVCMYFFDELCNSIMGDSDFRAICRNHKAIIIKHIPHIDLNNKNVANRFIKLLDEIYNNKVKLFCNAETGINQLAKTIKPEDAVQEQQFAINRCKSRLAQLQSRQYKSTPSYWELEQQNEIQ